MKPILLLFFYSLLLSHTNAQDNKNDQLENVFSRITGELKDFIPDTSTVANDKITRKIIQLRELRGGFNIHEAIQFKLAEERQKKEMAPADIDQLADFFTRGNGFRWLNNAMIHIYRDHFTFKELRRMVRFYKTTAGQKLASDFPVIMLKSLKAGEMIKDIYMPGQKKSF